MKAFPQKQQACSLLLRPRTPTPRWRWGLLALSLSALLAAPAAPQRARAGAGLAGYWMLAGGCRDHSGNGHHGTNHGVDLATGAFDGRGEFVEVADAPSLRVGRGEFSLAAWIETAEGLRDVFGDVVSKFDPARRRGYHFAVTASAGGYNSSSDARNLFLATDDGTAGAWEECGRPGGASHSPRAAARSLPGRRRSG